MNDIVATVEMAPEQGSARRTAYQFAWHIGKADACIADHVAKAKFPVQTASLYDNRPYERKFVMSTQFAENFARLNQRFPDAVAFGQAPMLHLYHAPNSVCSQKVRTVLFQQKRPFVSHLLNVFTGESYDPIYVKARLMGCASAGFHHLATGHGENWKGSTSASTTGCDACVVPMIADTNRQAFMVDSLQLCLSLDESNPDAPRSLMPASIEAEVRRHMAMIDNLPNYPLLGAFLEGRKADGSSDSKFSRRKVEWCEQLMAAHADDPDLVRAYQAKRDKELLAADNLFSNELLDRALARVSAALAELERSLPHNDGHFLFDEKMSLADIFWAIEIIRIADIGLGSYWENGALPKVAKYFALLCAQDSVRRAVLDWPQARIQKK